MNPPATGKKSSISHFFSPLSGSQSEKAKLDDARMNLAKFICDASVNPRAFSEECSVFKEMVNALNPNSSITFDLKSLQRDCLKIYGQQQKEVKEIFSKFHGHMSLSLDLFKYEHRSVILDYHCLTVHFIDDDWKLRKYIIKYGRSNCHASSGVILKSMKEWDIEDKVLSVTLGGATGIFDYIKEGIQETWKVPENGHMFYLLNSSCDIISHMVSKGFKEIEDIVSKVELLAWWKSCPLWYLTTSKLQNALELEALGEYSSENVDQMYDVPSQEEWAKVRSMCRIAEKIYEIVKGLFEFKKPTANFFLPYLTEIRAYLTQESANDDAFVKDVAQKMLKSFDEYWEETSSMLAIAAFMDPRYKMKFIRFAFSYGMDNDGDSKATSVLETIRKLYDGYAVHNDQRSYALTNLSEDEEDDGWSEFEDDKDEGEWSHGRAKRKHCNMMDSLNVLSSYCSSDQTKSDLDLYLEEPVYPWTEDFSVLLWWKDNCSKYPRLCKMARDFLAIPFSVASSYGAYTTEQREPDQTVLSLKNEFMNALMCTRSWKLLRKQVTKVTV